MAVPGNVGGVAFSGVTNVTEVMSAAAQTQVLARIDLVKALIPDPAAGRSAPHTDFDEIHPETARKLRAELDELKVKIDAAPTA